MPTHNGNPVFRGASGANAGRGDNPNGPSVVNRFSATTRKAQPITKEEYDSSIAKGETPKSSQGSKAAYSVTNSGGQAEGAGMRMVRDKYRESRKAGMSEDDARGRALTEYSYPAGTGPGGQQGPRIQQVTNPDGTAR